MDTSPGYAIYNPHAKPISDLPIIYGFNNGGEDRYYHGVLISEDGACLGDHLCSSEGWMINDLGILEGSRPDRHEEFRKHYPDGYRMDFVRRCDVDGHDGLQLALNRYDAIRMKGVE